MPPAAPRLDDVQHCVLGLRCPTSFIAVCTFMPANARPALYAGRISESPPAGTAPTLPQRGGAPSLACVKGRSRLRRLVRPHVGH